MATQTRFEGTINLGNVSELRTVTPLMSDNQLTFFFKVTKADMATPANARKMAAAHKVVKDEMAARVLDILADEAFQIARHHQFSALALRAGAVK